MFQSIAGEKKDSSPFQASFCVDLHVHSCHSTCPSQWILQKIGCGESYTPPRKIYDIARARGMNYVTITDHDTITGALEIAHLPQTFISEEISAYFPDDRCEVHVLAWNITEAQHKEITRLRQNIFELVPYLTEQGIAHACAHPLCAANNRLTLSHVEQLILLFSVFELNGARNNVQNEVLRKIVGALTPEATAKMEDKHGFGAHVAQPWLKSFVAGSDDHSSCNIARSSTVVEVSRRDVGQSGHAPTTALLRSIMAGRTTPRVIPATPLGFAHNLYAIGYQFYKNSTGLAQDINNSTVLRFAENMLTGQPDTRSRSIRTRVMSIGGFLLQCGRWVARSEKSMQENMLEAAGRAIGRSQDLLAAADSVNVILPQERMPQREALLASFVAEVTESVQLACSNAVLADVLKGNFFNVFKLVGAMGSLYAMLAPYGIGYSLFAQDKMFARECLRRFVPIGKKHEINGDRAAIAYFTDTYLEVNGVAKTLQSMLPLAREQGKKMDILTCVRPDSASDTPGSDLGPVNFCPIGSFSIPEYPELTLNYPPALKIVQHCYESGYTLLHSATPGPMGLAALLTAKMLKLPIHATYHTAFPQYILELTGDPSLEEATWRYVYWYYNQMDVVFAPSAATMKELIAHGLPEEKIRLYPRGVDASRYTPAWQGSQQGQDSAVRFLYVGRLSREKSVTRLVDAFRLVLEQMPSARLSIVGDGPQAEELQSQAAGMPVTFTGYLSGAALVRAYEQADIFVFPSTTDTYGKVVLEAQAAGLAVVVSGQGGPRENVIPGKSGLVVRQETAEAYASAMLALASDASMLLAMKHEARCYAESRSSQKAFAAQWKLIETLSPQACW
ncbi:glycosyltransferase [Desulfovibrio desulfuricans]|uniref:Glycosyltransferase n=1 Tax=Desulfovibrio desulfuricans TaxID=876 RepID=A0A4P7UIJ4_DESDE|nr:glycosyltransferase [Desulfovibrio desulfuricans]QCC85407.1 glycosyltransferase [Desulfovibrio desulfuricans]